MTPDHLTHNRSLAGLIRSTAGLIRSGVALALAAVALLAATAACSSIECPVQNTVTTQYALRSALGTDTLKDTLWVLTRRSDGTDTLLLNRGVGLTSFSLPVSYAHPEDTLLFVVADTAGVWTLDTLFIKKDDIPHFESVDCSAHFFHRLTAVRSTHQRIDSISIATPSVDYDASKTHFYIYFKARP